MTAAVIEPFSFLSVESLRAGWWLTWRLVARVAPIVAACMLVGFVLIPGAVGGFLMSIGFCAAGVWSVLLIPKLTNQWAQQRYGYPLESALKVWWGITWRGLVVSLVAAFIMAVPNVVALSFKTAYSGSVLGAAAGLVLGLLNLANVAVSVLSTGWAMSCVAAEQLGGLEPIVPAAVVPAPAVSFEGEVTDPVPAPRPAPRAAAPAPSAPAAVSADGKRQCPKCGLYETERGSVIGWYCKVCGWREGRR